MNPITPAQIRTFLIRRFHDQLCAIKSDPEAIADDFDLLKSGVIDSFGVIEMISALEAEFKIEIDMENLNPDDISILGKFCKHVAENHVDAKT